MILFLKVLPPLKLKFALPCGSLDTPGVEFSVPCAPKTNQDRGRNTRTVRILPRCTSNFARPVSSIAAFST